MAYNDPVQSWPEITRLAREAGAPGWVLGFHAEQAVEKALKAVLSYPRTHNLVMLMALNQHQPHRVKHSQMSHNRGQQSPSASTARQFSTRPALAVTPAELRMR